MFRQNWLIWFQPLWRTATLPHQSDHMFMAAMMQIANLVYIRLSPVLYVVTSLLNGFSLVIVGDFSIVYAALRLLRNPQPYFEYLSQIVSA